MGDAYLAGNEILSFLLRYIIMNAGKILLPISFSVFLSVSSAQTVVVRECGQKSFPGDVPAGNYSGIAHIGGNEYAVVSDKSDTDGFFVFSIDVDSVSGEITSVRNKGFRGDALKDRDCEGIVYCPSSSAFFISREADNVIAEYSYEGKATGRTLAVPEVYMANGGMGNYGFESLAYDGQTRLLWTMNESTLKGDGERATPASGVRNVLRLQSFDENLRPKSQFAYIMDAPLATNTATSNYAMGVSEMTALGDGRLAVLEREFYVPETKVGAFVRCKLYEVTPDDSIAIPADGRITDGTRFLPKRLLLSFKTRLGLFSWRVANYEGMCLGPTLADGSRTLILVSDSQNRYAGVLKDWFKTIVIR